MPFRRIGSIPLLLISMYLLEGNCMAKIILQTNCVGIFVGPKIHKAVKDNEHVHMFKNKSCVQSRPKVLRLKRNKT